MQPLMRTRGFTLIELMVTIAILAILITLAAPSFSNVIRSNRVASQTNALVTALNTARSEASKRGLPVTVCAAKDAAFSACSGDAADWQKFGWMVFTDAFGTAGQMDTAAGDELVTVTNAPPASTQFNTAYVFVRFNSDGSRMQPTDAKVTINVRHNVCDSANNEQRIVDINHNGRISLTKSACT
jgi:type IV fimbrial biogenesis protein FimT